MYKYSKDGVSVLTVLDKRKQKMNGLFPIKVQVIHNRKQKYYSTGQEVSIRDWEVLPHTKIVTYLKYDVTSKIVFL